MRTRQAALTGLLALGWLIMALAARAADVPADPNDYRALFDTLGPGDTLVLAPGDYTDGLRISGVNGEAGAPIVVEGPATGDPAVFLARSGANTIDITDSSHVTIRNLVFDGQDMAGIDAVKASGGAENWAHHITVENCIITRHDGGQTSQQTVGISTKIVAWDWVVRGNLIDGAGTGMYFGNSDGTRAFIGAVVEGNLFRSTLGYNMQIKHQLAREQVPGVPAEPRVTIIRNNVFIKEDNPSPDGGRPNLLVDGPPDSGPGSEDHVEIYGNFFYHNDEDALFQGNGRLHIHDNIFVDCVNAAVNLTAHEGKTVIDALVYNNTIYGTTRGISISGPPSGQSLVIGNAIFSDSPLSGATDLENVTDAVANAGTYVTNPSVTLGDMDFFPVSASPLGGAALDLGPVSSDVDYDLDFNGTPKSFTYRGAYEGEGTNRGWMPDDDFKLGGPAGQGGSSGAGATAGTGGSAGTGATAGTGAMAGTGTGASSGTGAAGAGGSPGQGGSAAAGAPASGDGDEGDEGGCGCRVPARAAVGGYWIVFVASLGGLLGRRRRRLRKAHR